MSSLTQSLPSCPDSAHGTRLDAPAGDGGGSAPAEDSRSAPTLPSLPSSRVCALEIPPVALGNVRLLTCGGLQASYDLLKLSGNATEADEVARGALAFLRQYDRVPPTRNRSEDELVELGAVVELLLRAWDTSPPVHADIDTALELVRSRWERSFLPHNISTIVSVEPGEG